MDFGEILKELREDNGLRSPYDTGFQAGYEEGHTEGYNEGFDEGKEEGLQEGATRIGPEIDKLSFAETQHLIRILVTKIELIINDDPQIYIKDIRIGGQ